MDGVQERKIIREPVKVIIYMESCRIRGVIYLDLDTRLSDFINTEINFLPITDALVESVSDRKWSYRVKFMNVNKNYIQSIFPEKELESELEQKWK
ncbi:MAG: hypothetical protein AB1633_08985 [Elusimicrobiota bacterium]